MLREFNTFEKHSGDSKLSTNAYLILVKQSYTVQHSSQFVDEYMNSKSFLIYYYAIYYIT